MPEGKYKKYNMIISYLKLGGYYLITGRFDSLGEKEELGIHRGLISRPSIHESERYMFHMYIYVTLVITFNLISIIMSNDILVCI